METEATRTIRSAGEPGDACAMVIFGASGDLTKRKLIPALYNLAKDNLLSRDFALIGFARPEMSHEEFRDKCTEELKQFATGQVDPDVWHWFVRRLYYLSGDFADPAAYQKLKTLLAEADKGAWHPGELLLLLGHSAGILFHLHSSGGRCRPYGRGQWPMATRHRGKAVRTRF